MSSAWLHSRCTSDRDRTGCRTARGPATTAAPVPPIRWATSTYSANCASRDATGTASPRSSPGQPRPSHCSYEAPTACCTGPGSPSSAARDRASAACCSIIPSSSRNPDSANSSADPEPVQRRVAPAHLAQGRGDPGDAPGLVLVLVRLQIDVVAEPLRLLMSIGMTAHVDQQRRVVNDRPRAVVQPGPLCQAQRDHALAQHVFHRLPEAEIDAERQGRHELGQPYRRTGGRAAWTRRGRIDQDLSPSVMNPGLGVRRRGRGRRGAGPSGLRAPRSRWPRPAPGPAATP